MECAALCARIQLADYDAFSASLLAIRLAFLLERLRDTGGDTEGRSREHGNFWSYRSSFEIIQNAAMASRKQRNCLVVIGGRGVSTTNGRGMS